MSEELLPCPFCEGKAEFSIGKTGDGKDWHYLECSECGAMGPTVEYADHNIAVKESLFAAWNTRADLASERVAAVKVKPLEWFDYGKHEYPESLGSSAEECGHFYRIDACGSKWEMVGDLKGEFESLDEAKAAAQADYERRILSALDSPVDANALVAAAYATAAMVVTGHDDYDQNLCCGGQECGCYGGSVHDSIRHHIRELTPDDAKSALDAMLKAERAKVHKNGQAAAFAQVIGHLTKYRPDQIGNVRAQGYYRGWMDALAAVRKMAREKEG